MVPRTDGPPTVVIPPVVIPPIIPDVLIPPVVIPSVVKPPTQTPNYSALIEYIKDQHGITIGGAKHITQDKLPWLAFSETTGKPTLFEDHVLHETLKLPDAYRVVSSKLGHLHMAYDPEKVQPKFELTKMHNAETVSIY
jgi:hypothetical protein